MKLWSVVITITAACALALAGEAAPKGHLVLIGGGEEPWAAMKKFVELAGGPEAPIVLLPTASEEPDSGTHYTGHLKEHGGSANVTVLDIKTREDAAKPEFVAAVQKARGIFFGGGDQSRITRALLDTPVGNAIAERFAQGATVGGTSAGCACQSSPMITGEGDFKVIRAGAVELVRGLGFFRDVIVDQHFIARQRENRLLTVILEHPELVGVGVDENTAVWVRPDNTFEVVGAASVMVLDTAGAAIRRGAGEKGKELLGVHDLRVHILVAGEQYDVGKRAIVVPVAPKGAAK